MDKQTVLRERFGFHFFRDGQEALIDEPAFVRRLMARMVEIEMSVIDQLEAQNLLAAGPGTKCHCIETYVDEDR